MTHVCPKTKVAIINNEYLTGCKQCLKTVVHSADGAAAYKRRQQGIDHRQDIVQRYDGDKINPDWIKLYEDKAREEFGDQKVEELLRNN